MFKKGNIKNTLSAHYYNNYKLGTPIRILLHFNFYIINNDVNVLP